VNDDGHTVARTVVRFLGAVAVIAALGSIFLVYESIGYQGIDPATVALVNVPGNLASAALGALGAILATAGRNSGGSQPSGTPADPVNVTPVAAPADVPLSVTDGQPAPASRTPEAEPIAPYDIHPDAPATSDL
jgi:hypothetical protein